MLGITVPTSKNFCKNYRELIIESNVTNNIRKRPIKSFNVRYHCGHCSFSTRLKIAFKRHLLLSHSNLKLLNCSSCTFMCPGANQYINHIHSHFNSIMFKCVYCQMYCKSKESYDQHLLMEHSEPRPVHSTSTGNGFAADNSRLVSPTRTFEGFENVTSTGKHFKKVISTRKRLKKVTSKGKHFENVASSCKRSEKVTSMDSCLSSASSRFECEYCRRHFSTQGNLLRHVNCAHLKKRPFKCVECKRSYSRYIYLKRHIEKIHIVNGMFICTLCGLKYKAKSSLNAHIKLKHPLSSRT